jgi:hypothetical protein
MNTPTSWRRRRSALRHGDAIAIAVGMRQFRCIKRIANVDRGIEQIAAPRHRADQPSIVVAQGTPRFVNAAYQRVLGDEDVRPDRAEDFVFLNELPGVFYQELKDPEGLRPEVELTIRVAESAAALIEGESLETVHFSIRWVHLRTSRGKYRRFSG